MRIIAPYTRYRWNTRVVNKCKEIRSGVIIFTLVARDGRSLATDRQSVIVSALGALPVSGVVSPRNRGLSTNIVSTSLAASPGRSIRGRAFVQGYQ